jgi:hypothetical protein
MVVISKIFSFQENAFCRLCKAIYVLFTAHGTMTNKDDKKCKEEERKNLFVN